MKSQKKVGTNSQRSASPAKPAAALSKTPSPPNPNSISSNPSSLVLALRPISGKWKIQVLAHLFSGTQRFSELRRSIPGIGRAMLSFELHQLRQDGLIHRTQYETIPPTVEYSLTAKGGALRQVLIALQDWADAFGRGEN